MTDYEDRDPNAYLEPYQTKPEACQPHRFRDFATHPSSLDDRCHECGSYRCTEPGCEAVATIDDFCPAHAGKEVTQ